MSYAYNISQKPSKFKKQAERFLANNGLSKRRLDEDSKSSEVKAHGGFEYWKQHKKRRKFDVYLDIRNPDREFRDMVETQKRERRIAYEKTRIQEKKNRQYMKTFEKRKKFMVRLLTDVSAGNQLIGYKGQNIKFIRKLCKTTRIMLPDVSYYVRIIYVEDDILENLIKALTLISICFQKKLHSETFQEMQEFCENKLDITEIKVKLPILFNEKQLEVLEGPSMTNWSNLKDTIESIEVINGKLPLSTDKCIHVCGTVQQVNGCLEKMLWLLGQADHMPLWGDHQHWYNPNYMAAQGYLDNSDEKNIGKV